MHHYSHHKLGSRVIAGDGDEDPFSKLCSRYMQAVTKKPAESQHLKDLLSRSLWIWKLIFALWSPTSGAGPRGSGVGEEGKAHPEVYIIYD